MICSRLTGSGFSVIRALERFGETFATANPSRNFPRAILLTLAATLGEMKAEEQTPPQQATGSYEFVPEKGGHVEAIGEVLFTRYIYPFEIMAIMLLAGIIGAVLLTKKSE